MRGWLHGTERQERVRRKFSDEFKRDAVELVRTSGRPIAEVAEELGVQDSTLGDGRQRERDEGEREGLTTDERAAKRASEAENAQLRMERDLLKRTVAFWVKEST